MSSAAEASGETPRGWDAWMKLASQTTIYPIFASKAIMANLPAAIGGSIIIDLVIILISAMFCGLADAWFPLHATALEIWGGVTAALCLFTSVMCSHDAMKERREIEEDRDAEGHGLYTRTLAKEKARMQDIAKSYRESTTRSQAE